MSAIAYLEPDTVVTFELQSTLPIFSERYVSAQAGTVVLKGFFNQKAHIETLHGERYRMVSPRRDKKYPNQIAYPIVHLPDKTEVFRFRTPVYSLSEKTTPPTLRYTAMVEKESYILKRATRLGRAFEVWDGMEIQCIVKREPRRKLIDDSVILAPVPVLLVLLLPWMDSQTLFSGHT
jgi:hypothetical protein